MKLRFQLLRFVLVSLFVANTSPLWAATSTTDFHYPNQIAEKDLSFYQRAFSTEPYTADTSCDPQPRQVILCIGDGMGLGQVTLARLQAVGISGKLHMERLPVQGLITTHAANQLVTDSAAAGTALACGIKTNNGMIGQSPDGQHYASVLALAQQRGLLTGLVVTSAITHATPASFAAHVPSRGQETVIAQQLLDTHVNVLFGGGRKFFLPATDPNSKRKDDRNLLEEAQAAGYTVISDPAQLWACQSPHVLGLFQVEPLTTKAPEPSLAELTTKAINLLNQPYKNSKRPGFFLMVEGSQIDWACHKNNVDNTIRQTLLFDQAVKAAMDFALQDTQTLVIVTADHETGGLSVTGDYTSGPKANWNDKKHSAMPVPIYAFGPGAARFVGTQDNTEVAKHIAQLLRLGNFPHALRNIPNDTAQITP